MKRDHALHCLKYYITTLLLFEQFFKKRHTFLDDCSTAFSDFGKFSSQTLPTVNPLKPSFKTCTTQPCFKKKVIENVNFTIFLLLKSIPLSSHHCSPNNYFWTLHKKGATPMILATISTEPQIFHKRMKPLENSTVWYSFSIMRNLSIKSSPFKKIRQAIQKTTTYQLHWLFC